MSFHVISDSDMQPGQSGSLRHMIYLCQLARTQDRLICFMKVGYSILYNIVLQCQLQPTGLLHFAEGQTLHNAAACDREFNFIN